MSTLGTGNNLTYAFDGTNTLITYPSGNFTLDNTTSTGAIVVKLGSLNTSTAFQVKNNTGTNLFEVKGDGTITPSAGGGTGNWLFAANDAGISGTPNLIQLATSSVTITKNILTPDNISIIMGTGSDLALVHDGTDTLVTSTTGNLIIDNTNVAGTIILQVGTVTGNTEVQVANNSEKVLFKVSGDGTYTAQQGSGISMTDILSIANNVTLNDTGYSPCSRTIASNPINLYLSGSILPIVLGSGALFNVNGTLLLVGGFSGGNSIKILRSSVNDPETWVDTGSVLPADASASLPYTGQDGLYLFGSEGGTQNNIMFASYSNILSWTSVGTMAVGRYLAQWVRYKDTIAMVGGLTSGVPAPSVYVLNPANPANLTLLGNLSGAITTITNYASVQIGNEVFMMGGSNSTGNSLKIFKIPIDNPLVVTDTGFVLPSGMDRPKALVVNNRLYLYSNSGSKVYSASVFDLSTWTATTNVPSNSLSDTEIIVIEDTLYVFGGNVSNAIYKSRPTFILDNDTNLSIGKVNTVFSSGTDNIVIGQKGIYNLAAAASANIAIGNYCMPAVTGSNNVGIGTSGGGSQGVLAGLTTGNSNTAVGWRAGESITSGINNTALGREAYISGNFSNSTCLGYQSTITADNQVQLGNAATTTYAYGVVQNRSDQRDKTDIEDSDLGVEFITKLITRKYRWDYRQDYVTSVDETGATTMGDFENVVRDGSKKRSRFHYGLIAQELKALMDEMGIDFGGYQDHKINGGKDCLSISYTELIAPLIRTIQKNDVVINDIKSRIEALER